MFLAVARVRQLARVLKESPWSTGSPGGPRTKRLDQLERQGSGQCGWQGATPQQVKYLP